MRVPTFVEKAWCTFEDRHPWAQKVPRYLKPWSRRFQILLGWPALALSHWRDRPWFACWGVMLFGSMALSNISQYLNYTSLLIRTIGWVSLGLSGLTVAWVWYQEWRTGMPAI